MKILTWLTTLPSLLNNERHKFNDWIASKIPGWKTNITAAIAFVGNAAFAFQSYIQEIPVEFIQKYVTGDNLVIFNLVLLSLIFWFRTLANRSN